MLANILSEMGVFMGHLFPPADEYNPLGYWEDLEFVAASQKLMECQMLNRVPPQLTALKNLIAEREKHHEVWGWKDRQTLMTAYTWDTLLPNPFYLFSTRDPQAIVESYLRSWKRSRSEIENCVWVWHRQAQDFLRDRPHLVVDYDVLIQTREVAHVADFIELDCDLEKARAVIRPELRNHAA